MARALSRLHGVEVIEAGSVREARAALERGAPAVLVSDLDLPDGSGVEIAALLDQARIRIPIIFVSAYVSRFRAQLVRRTDVEVYEKPLPMDRLRARVENALVSTSAGPAPFGVADYVQLAAMGRHTVVLEVRGIKVEGRIVIERGEARSAVDSIGGGMDAFRRLAFLETATVRCRGLARGEAFERNISGSCESILLEAARMHDEWARPRGESELEHELEHELAAEAAPEPAPDAAPAPATARVSARFEAHYDAAIEAMLTKDFRAAFEAFRAASEIEPDDPRVRANMTRLRAMGYAT